jgi:glyoxylase I family protein
MSADIAKDAIDLAIVARDAEASVAFYRDFLGLEHVADTTVGSAGVMHRFRVGDSLLKLLELKAVPEARPAPGGMRGGSGYRFWTLWVNNLDEMVADAKSRGYEVPSGPLEVRPGDRMAMVVDPDGNWVELLENTGR